MKNFYDACGELEKFKNSNLIDTPYELFTCYLCMIFEEYCLKNNLDVVEFVKMLDKMVDEVNASEGKYLG